MCIYSYFCFMHNLLVRFGDIIMEYTKKAGFAGVVFSMILVSILVIITTQKVYAPVAEANDTITIFVNITQKTMVDINPSSLSWYDLEPGNDYNGTWEVNNYDNIWIENIGSVNITKIWLNNSYPPSRPFATGNPLAYDPANFIVIANNSVNSPDSMFMYINRVEYEEDDPLYIKVPNTSLNLEGVIFGRFRNGSYEYFFEYTSSYPNNCSNGNFYINTSAPKTQTDTGDVDLTDNTPITFTPVIINTGGGVQDGKQYDVGLISFNNGREQYCVFIPVACAPTGERVYFVRWNADFLADPTVQTLCGNLNQGYLNKDPVAPGGFYKAWVRVRVPYGTATGDLSPGTITVYASSL